MWNLTLYCFTAKFRVSTVLKKLNKEQTNKKTKGKAKTRRLGESAWIHLKSLNDRPCSYASCWEKNAKHATPLFTNAHSCLVKTNSSAEKAVPGAPSMLKPLLHIWQILCSMQSVSYKKYKYKSKSRVGGGGKIVKLQQYLLLVRCKAATAHHTSSV